MSYNNNTIYPQSDHMKPIIRDMKVLLKKYQKGLKINPSEEEIRLLF